MVKTLERIWIDSKGVYPYFYPKEPSDSVFPVTEYIRADLCHRPAPTTTDRADDGKFEGDRCKRCGGKGEIVVGKGRHGDTIIEDCPSCSTPQDVINLVIAAKDREIESITKSLIIEEQLNAAKDARIGEYETGLVQMHQEMSALEADNKRLREALDMSEAAISEYYRYRYGGELRGSYDGKPERDGLWKAMHKARAALGEVKP